MSFTYTPGVPNPPNFPSQDVGNMQDNSNSINNIWAVDHFTFASGVAGRHKQVSLVNQAVVGVPGGTSGVLFSNVVGGNNQLFWQSPTEGTTQIPNFDSTVQPVNATSGISHLPGGLIIQWGQRVAPGLAGQIIFPIPFPNGVNAPFSIQVSVEATAASRTVNIDNGTPPTFDHFNYQTNGSVATLYWMAIGN